MKRNVLLLWFVSLLGLLLVSSQVPVASACVPTDDDMTRCDRLLIARPKAAPVVAAVKAPITAPPPSPKRGTSPSDAMDPNDSWQTIGANHGVWYRLGEDTISRLHLDVWLDVYGKTGIGFAVYSPEQMGDLSGAAVPKGRGTVNRNDLTHDLSWSGQAPAGGTWYVLVTNSNSNSLQYKLGYNRVVTGPREGCGGSYAEHLGAWVNSDVVWPGYCP